MTHIRSRLLLATTVAGLVLSTAAQAQGAPPRPREARRDQQPPAGMMRRAGAQPGGPMAGRGQGADGARFGGQRGPRGNPAAMVLRLRSELQLTDEQVRKLEALQDAPAPAANGADLLRARADLLEATQGDGNLAKARAALDRMSAQRNERMIAGLKQRQEVRAVLTSTQKTRLDNFRRQLRGRAGARGQRGPRMGGKGIGRGQGRGMGGQFGPGGRPGMRGGMRGMPGMRGGMGPGAPVPPSVPPAPRPPEGDVPPA
jgi:Spy/CpxP family protein refolding chaperone